MAPAIKQTSKIAAFDELDFADELNRLLTSAMAIVACVADAADYKDEPTLADALHPASEKLSDAYSLIQRWNNELCAGRALEARRTGQRAATADRPVQLDAGTIERLERLIKMSKQQTGGKRAA